MTKYGAAWGHSKNLQQSIVTIFKSKKNRRMIEGSKKKIGKKDWINGFLAEENRE